MNIKEKCFYIFIYALGLVSSGVTCSIAQEKPNIIFILADDLGYTDLGCYGNVFNETPHIDSLAKSGMKFIHAYAASPVCSPSRAAILTGKHPARLHLTNFLGGERKDPLSPVLPAAYTRYLASGETTLADMLKANQYACGQVGKWHLGTADSLLPTAQGFDFERMIAKNGLDYYNYTITSKNKTVFEDKGEEYLTDKLTDYGIEFIRQKKDQPFFLFLTYSAPHVVLVPRADKLRKYFFKYPKFDKPYNPNYAAMLESLDDGVGRILHTLRELQIEKNTIIIFTSDNGGVGLDELGPTPTNLNPLRAWKGHVYEGGIRIPLIVKWPDKIKPAQINENLVINTDFFPTFSALVGIKENKKDSKDGRNMLNTWFDPAISLDRGPVYWHYPHFSNQLGRPSGAIRDGDYKLVENYENGKTELYNLVNDMGEKNDLSKTHPEKLKELLDEFRRWKKEVHANMPAPNPAFNK